MTCSSFYRTPVLARLLKECSKKKDKNLSKEKEIAVTTVLCKLVNIYNVELNAHQKLFGLLLRTSGTSKRAINKLCKMYDSVSYSTLTKILDNFAQRAQSNGVRWNNQVVIHAAS